MVYVFVRLTRSCAVKRRQNILDVCFFIQRHAAVGGRLILSFGQTIVSVEVLSIGEMTFVDAFYVFARC